MFKLRTAHALGAALLLAAGPLAAKPIAFQNGRTLMYEYGAGTIS